jgi:predicted ATPase
MVPAYVLQRLGGDVDPDDAAVVSEPRAVSSGTAAGVEDHLLVAEPRLQQIADERAGVAVPPVVGFDRGDACVLGVLQAGDATAVPVSAARGAACR